MLTPIELKKTAGNAGVIVNLTPQGTPGLECQLAWPHRLLFPPVKKGGVVLNQPPSRVLLLKVCAQFAVIRTRRASPSLEYGGPGPS